MADEVDIREIVVPPNPGVFSAVGLTVSDVRMDYVLAEGAQLASSLTPAMLSEKLETLRARAQDAFGTLGYDPAGLAHQFTVDARYRGQGYELRVPVDEARLFDEGQAYLAECFHQEHARQYGHAFRERDVEAISFRLTALHPRGRSVTPVSEESAALPPGDRQVLYGGESRAYPVVARTSLSPGHKADGPLIVVEDSTSTLVPPGWSLHADDLGVLHLSRQEGASQ